MRTAALIYNPASGAHRKRDRHLRQGRRRSGTCLAGSVFARIGDGHRGVAGRYHAARAEELSQAGFVRPLGLRDQISLVAGRAQRPPQRDRPARVAGRALRGRGGAPHCRASRRAQRRAQNRSATDHRSRFGGARRQQGCESRRDRRLRLASRRHRHRRLAVHGDLRDAQWRLTQHCTGPGPRWSL